jgi:hypothetical protein
VIVLALRFSVQWQPLAKYILAGITVMVTAELMVTSVRAVFGAHANAFGRIFRPTAFLLGVGVWFFYICIARIPPADLRAPGLHRFRQSLEEVAR